MASTKDEKELDELAAKYGFTRDGFTKRGHIKYIHCNGEVVFASPTATEYRAIKNLEAEFKRRGSN